MYIFAFLPLSIYFFCLFRLNRQQHPTMLDGGQDFLLLAFGLFGFITLGPGKLLIPLKLMTFWGFPIWLFWSAFYFSVAHILSRCLMNRIVIYHCSRQWFLEKFPEYIRTQGMEVRISGNVLFLPDLAIQCVITGDRFDGHTLLVSSESTQSKPQQEQWKALNNTVKTFCLTTNSPKTRASLFWGATTTVTGVWFLTVLVQNSSVLFQQIQDLWF